MKIDEQMRIIISNRNRKETSLKSELHSAQLQLRSTLNHHKIVREEAIILKKDFKQKEDKFLEEFLDIKRLKEKVEDRLYKQDQSVQTVHMICKPKSFYDEKNKVAIGYKNPLCLTRAKQVQPALYNGHVLVMSNHARPVVHDLEDTREISEITRKRMLEKMKSPLCVENKIRIAPPDYSKENLLATFAPQRNLTPEQIIDNNDRKKAETSVPKPLSALTVYPPNTPVKLVPRVLPTKSVTEGERGFEQTKRCYLTEVIPFFKTLKEHFAGVQTALFKEVKVMEEIFDQMNDEVDQNTVDKQCAEIERKNLLIANENLIANCLSNQLLYDVEKSRCLDLEAEMSKVHNESKHISKLERENINLQLKYQHLQESFDNNKSQTSQEAPDLALILSDQNLEHQLQEKDNLSQKLVEYVIGTCPKEFIERDSKAPSIPLTRKKQVTFTNNTQKHGVHQKVPTSNVHDSSNRIINGDPQERNHSGKLNCGYRKEPTGKKNLPWKLCPLTRIPVTVTAILGVTNRTPTQIGDPKFQTLQIQLFSSAVVRSILWYLDSGYSKLNLEEEMAPALDPQCLKMFEHSIEASAPFPLKNKKGVRFSALILNRRRMIIPHQQIEKRRDETDPSFPEWLQIEKKAFTVDLQKLAKESYLPFQLIFTGLIAFKSMSNWLTLSFDDPDFGRPYNVTPTDSAHPFEAPPLVKLAITVKKEKSSFKLVDEDEVQPALEPHMDDYEHNLITSDLEPLEIINQAQSLCHLINLAILWTCDIWTDMLKPFLKSFNVASFLKFFNFNTLTLLERCAVSE
ncbi:hypothetical protein Tco_0392693 [Tanacetum coccineum]